MTILLLMTSQRARVRGKVRSPRARAKASTTILLLMTSQRARARGKVKSPRAKERASESAEHFGSPSDLKRTVDAVAWRVDGGWAAASIGNLFLMPVGCSEMLRCEAFLQSFSGHLVHGASILALISVFAASIWRQVMRSQNVNMIDWS